MLSQNQRTAKDVGTPQNDRSKILKKLLLKHGKSCAEKYCDRTSPPPVPGIDIGNINPGSFTGYEVYLGTWYILVIPR